MYLISNCFFIIIILLRNTSWEGEYKEGGYYYLNNFNDLLHSYGKRLENVSG